MRGGVRKRGTTWTWYLDAPPDPVTGKRRQASKGGFRTRREAQEALNEALARLREGTFVLPSQRTLGSFLLEEWLPAVRPPRVRPSTWESYRMNAEAHIVPALGHLPLQRLTPAQLTAFYRFLLDHGRRGGGGLAAKTVRNIRGELHAALRDAVRWGHVARNVAASADLPKGMTPEMHVWSPEQLRAFLGHARKDRLYAAWLLFATTGMRRGEVAGLRWPDVDLGAGRVSPRRPRVVVNYEVHVSEPKTAKGRRSLALDPAMVAALRQHRARQAEERLAVGPRWHDSGLVFTWPDGRPIHPQRFSTWFEQLAQAAGLPRIRIRLHDVRHGYASAALAAGIPAKVVSERLGHATIAVTMDTYSHVLPGLDAEAAGTVARLILGDRDQEPARPVDKALTTDRPTASKRGEVKREAPGQRGVRAGGFEPPRVAPPGPKLPTRCASWSSPGLYQAFTLGRRQSVVPSCTRSSRGVVARPVSNLVSIGGSGPVWSRTPAALRSSATRDRSADRARHGEGAQSKWTFPAKLPMPCPFTMDPLSVPWPCSLA
jgi:integrase